VFEKFDGSNPHARRFISVPFTTDQPLDFILARWRFSLHAQRLSKFYRKIPLNTHVYEPRDVHCQYRTERGQSPVFVRVPDVAPGSEAGDSQTPPNTSTASYSINSNSIKVDMVTSSDRK
jgi:hypothetical protein